MVVPFLVAAMGEARAERPRRRRPAYWVEESSIVWRSGLRVEVPARQLDFGELLQEYIWHSRIAPDGTAQTRLRDERDARVMREFGRVEGWIGRVMGIRPTGTGTAHLNLTLLPSWTLLSTGVEDPDLISRGSPLWPVVGHLEDGQVVRLSGEMIRVNYGKVVPKDDAAALMRPSFCLRFKQIEALP